MGIGSQKGRAAMRELVETRRAGRIATLAETTERARAYFDASQARNTRRAYASGLRHFQAWCEGRGLEALPAAPQTVALYFADHAGTLKVSTLQQRLSAIAGVHKLKGLDSPTRHAAVTTVWSGIKRTHGTAQQGKAPVLGTDLRAMLAALPGSLTGIRDRALLLVGFGGAFRRSELVALDWSDIEETAEGLVVTLKRSKTDQEGEGAKVGIPQRANVRYLPRRGAPCLERGIRRRGSCVPKPHPAWSDWRAIVGQGTPISRVAIVVKRAAASARLDPSRFSGHSLRAGLATSAAAAGASERAIGNQTRHKSLKVLRGYIREGSLFRENAAATVL